VDKVEGCEAPADDEEVQDIEKGSRLHKKLRAKISIRRYFSASVAGPLKITGYLNLWGSKTTISFGWMISAIAKIFWSSNEADGWISQHGRPARNMS
jgi:hypothetical protein